MSRVISDPRLLLQRTERSPLIFRTGYIVKAMRPILCEHSRQTQRERGIRTRSAAEVCPY